MSGLAQLRGAHREEHAVEPCDAALDWPQCRWCHPDLPMPGAHFRPTSLAEWAGKARMASARLNAGIELDDLDREALAKAGQR